MSNSPASRPMNAHWRWVGRGLWLAIAGTTLAFYAGSLPAAFDKWRSPHPVVECQIPCGPLGPVEWMALPDLGLSPEAYAGYHVLLVVLLGLIPFAIGLLTYLRRPDHWPTWYLSLVLALLGFMVPPVFDAGVEVHPSWGLPVTLLVTFGRASILISLYLFPDAEFVPRWTGALAVLVASMFAFMFIFPEAPANLVYADTMYQNFSPPTLILGAGWLGTGVFAQIYRYLRVSGPVERQQTKWVVFGWVAGFVGFVGYIAPYFVFPALAEPSLARLRYFVFALPGFQLSVVLIPIFTALAISRYRLWEIDVLINRSLVYGGLTGTLGSLYLGSVIVLQWITPVESEFAIVASTLLAAALFSPLRQRIQEGIDMRFYRRKYDAGRTLARFATTVRDQVELEKLIDETIAVVGETVQPAFVSLWLMPDPEADRATRPHGEAV